MNKGLVRVLQAGFLLTLVALCIVLAMPGSTIAQALTRVNLVLLNGVTPSLNNGAAAAGTIRVTEATDSQQSAGLGATGDAAATAGSTGSINAKLRLSTTLLDDIKTALEDANASDVAHGTADTGNPVKIGGRARIADPTAEADNDRVNAYFNKLGKMVVELNAIRERRVGNRIALTTTTETTLIAAGASGIFRDLAALHCNNESATKVRVDIRDATGGTVRLSRTLAADGGGFEKNLVVAWPQTTAANNWTAQLSGAVSTVYCDALVVEDK